MEIHRGLMGIAFRMAMLTSRKGLQLRLQVAVDLDRESDLRTINAGSKEGCLSISRQDSPQRPRKFKKIFPPVRNALKDMGHSYERAPVDGSGGSTLYSASRAVTSTPSRSSPSPVSEAVGQPNPWSSWSTSG